MSERSPTLADVIRTVASSMLGERHYCLPGCVTAWDPQYQRATVQPLVRSFYTAEDGDREVEALPPVPGVPVQFMGAGGFRITFPIDDGTVFGKPATTGLIFFSELCLDDWLSGAGDLVSPSFDRRSALADAIFIPGLKPFGAPWQSMPTDCATLGSDGGMQIELRDSEVDMGHGAAQAVLRGTQYAGVEEPFVDALAQWIIAATPVLSALATAGGMTADAAAITAAGLAFTNPAGAYAMFVLARATYLQQAIDQKVKIL